MYVYVCILNMNIDVYDRVDLYHCIWYVGCRTYANSLSLSPSQFCFGDKFHVPRLSQNLLCVPVWPQTHRAPCLPLPTNC